MDKDINQLFDQGIKELNLKELYVDYNPLITNLTHSSGTNHNIFSILGESGIKLREYKKLTCDELMFMFLIVLLCIFLNLV